MILSFTEIQHCFFFIKNRATDYFRVFFLSVNEDYSNRVIKKRTELMPKLKEATRKNQRAFLRFDKLVIYDNPVNSGSTNDERASGESSNAD